MGRRQADRLSFAQDRSALRRLPIVFESLRFTSGPSVKGTSCPFRKDASGPGDSYVGTETGRMVRPNYSCVDTVHSPRFSTGPRLFVRLRRSEHRA